jgi:hypothetical protein
VFIQRNGIWLPLVGADAGSFGEMATHGANVNIKYSLGLSQ